MQNTKKHNYIASRLICFVLIFMLIISMNFASRSFALETGEPDVSEPDNNPIAIGSPDDPFPPEFRARQLDHEEFFETDNGSTNETIDGGINEVGNGSINMGVLGEKSPLMAEASKAAKSYSYTDVIDLSMTTGSGSGYMVLGPGPANCPGKYIPPYNSYLLLNPNYLLNFTGAGGNAYNIIQTGVYNPAGGQPALNPDCPQYGTSIFSSIIISTGAVVTLVIDNIDLIGSITLMGTAKLTLVLDGKNFIRTTITVPSTAELTIDSLNGSDTSDRLIMPSANNAANVFATIGGASGANSGTINIDGGSIEIVAHSTGAGIGGGGGSAGVVAGNGGITRINGGSVSVTQYGNNGNTGTGASGAGIGGGGGTTVNGGHAGEVIINNGIVKVRQYTRAAGIGGGTFGSTGHVTINGGDVDVEVIRADNLGTGSGEGSPIGAASGTNYPGPGYIDINGGTIKAVASDAGGAGIGIANGGQPVHIKITDGTVYAKSTRGAGIGCFVEERGTSITITGGTVVAESVENAGIGSKVGNEPLFSLGPGANVKAYSRGEVPAINAQNNTGSGYFVNASLNAAISPSAATTMHVFKEGTGGVPLKTLSLPATWRNFAYSTDQSASRTDNVLVYDGSVYTGIILRVEDNSPHIYSMISRSDYNIHNPANQNKGFLPVKLSDGAGINFTVTEKHVDEYGNAIAGVADNPVTIAFGGSYSKPVPAIPGCVSKGYKWDSAPDGSGTDYTSGSPTSTAITTDRIIYYVYEAFSDVTITKTVTGRFADYTKPFTFTAYFMDSNGNPMAAGKTFAYTGGVISGSGATAPPNGALTLATGGQASFTLKHGQTITISSISAGVEIEIVETEDYYYNASYTDSAYVVKGSKPGELEIFKKGDTGVQTLGAGDRMFDFLNALVEIVPTGIGGGVGIPLLLLVIGLLLNVVLLVAVERKRRKRVWLR